MSPITISRQLFKIFNKRKPKVIRNISNISIHIFKITELILQQRLSISSAFSGALLARTLCWKNSHIVKTFGVLKMKSSLISPTGKEREKQGGPYRDKKRQKRDEVQREKGKKLNIYICTMQYVCSRTSIESKPLNHFLKFTLKTMWTAKRTQ